MGAACPRIGWGGGGERPPHPNCAGKERGNPELAKGMGAPSGTPPPRPPKDVPDLPLPFSRVFAPRWLRRDIGDTSCAGLSPAEGKTPLGGLERGRAHPSVGAVAPPNPLAPALGFWESPPKDSRGGGGGSVLHGWQGVGQSSGGV